MKSQVFKNIGLAIFLLISPNIFGQNTSVEEIFNRYFEAVASKDTILSIKSIHAVSEAKLNGYTLTLNTKLLYPNKKSIRARVDSLNISEFLFDGKNAWVKNKNGTRIIEGLELENLKSESTPFLELNANETSILKGIEKLRERNVYVVQIFQNSFAYYDCYSGLKLRYVNLKKTKDSVFTQTIDYRDYKSIQGIKYPHEMEISSGNHAALYTLVDLQINSGVKPSDFN
jgi:hypothetical protein